MSGISPDFPDRKFPGGAHNRERNMIIGFRTVTLAAILMLISGGCSVETEDVSELNEPGVALLNGSDNGLEKDTANISVSGTATIFGHACNVIPEAKIHVFERPDIKTVSAEDGTFYLDGFRAGEDVSLIIEAPGMFPTQLATMVPGNTGVENLTFQVPWNAFTRGLAWLTGLDPDLNKCQVATTVTRINDYEMPQCSAAGEPGAVVTIDPPLSPDHGPVYFDENTIPDSTMSETSVDGGVVFSDVPPGEYVLRAQKEGVVFSEVRIKCHPHMLVNASPPWGIQAIEGGIGAP